MYRCVVGRRPPDAEGQYSVCMYIWLVVIKVEDTRTLYSDFLYYFSPFMVFIVMSSIVYLAYVLISVGIIHKIMYILNATLGR